MGDARGWLDALPAHPMFATPAPGGGRGPERTACLAARGTDLLAVVHGQVRLTSLAEVKRAAAGGEGAGAGGSYKVRAQISLPDTR